MSYPRNAQGSKTSWAQSGGINRTFGGGKGGSAYGREATKTQVTGVTRSNRGLKVTRREEGGDKTLVRRAFRGAGRLLSFGRGGSNAAYKPAINQGRDKNG